ncbi:MAG: FHA domain-containing protein [Myxococcota bacterium]
MSVLILLADQRAHPLQPHTIIGRSRACTIQLRDDRVSKAHAELSWNGSCWQLRDQSSRNGTWIDEQRLEPGQVRVLRANQTVSFGAPELSFQLADAGPPRAYAIETASGEALIGTADALTLGAPPAVDIRRQFDDAGEMRWVRVAPTGGAEPVESGAVMRVEQRQWTLHLPDPMGQTRSNPDAIDGLRLLLVRGAGGAPPKLTVFSAQRRIEMGKYAHNRLLLVLAEERLADAELPGAEQGWLHERDVAAALGVAVSTVLTYIKRARDQVEQAGILGARGVVERSEGSGRVRLGIDAVEIQDP